MESLRRCSRCGEFKPIAEFTWKDKARGKHQSYCRVCMNAAWREWYSKEANRTRHLSQVADRRRRRAERHRRLILALKKQPCRDCGQTYPPYVMDFDHIGEKSGEVSKFVYTNGTATLLAEIEQCDVVCANCHRIRTHERLRRQPSV
jgi:hypothetical protein